MLWLVTGLTLAAEPAATLLTRHADRPVVVAHRGASAVAPENTLVAYREALARGAEVAETDVFLTADGRVVAIHDETLDRTTDGTGLVSAHRLAELEGLDAGSWFDPAFAGEPVPTLDALLDLARDRLVLCIEIKAGEGIVSAIGELLDARDMRDQVVIFSFDPAAVAAASEGLPEVPSLLLASRTGVVPHYEPAVVDQARALGAEGLGFNHRHLTAEMVSRVHEAGLAVFVYTVNDAEVLRRVTSMGVDGVITDRPDEVDVWLER